jgi:hypothetical protein
MKIFLRLMLSQFKLFLFLRLPQMGMLLQIFFILKIGITLNTEVMSWEHSLNK